MRTSVYIDGFNFYFRAVKNTPYKWLDFKKLVSILLQPHHQIIVLISNDSDLAEPLRLIRNVVGKKIGLIFPAVRGHPSKELQQHAHFIKRIRVGVLQNSQLPIHIPGTKLTKPKGW